MSSPKHTPGPWSIREGGRSWYVEPDIYKNKICIAEVWTKYASKDQSKADAQLIAAAPALLAALENILKVCAEVPEQVWMDAYKHVDLQVNTFTFDDAKRALKQAKGES
jgi:hypothetical protein